KPISPHIDTNPQFLLLPATPMPSVFASFDGEHQSFLRVPLAWVRNQTRGLKTPCFCLATAAGATCSRRLQGGGSTSTFPPISRSSQEYCPTLTSTSNPILYTTPTPIP